MKKHYAAASIKISDMLEFSNRLPSVQYVHLPNPMPTSATSFLSYFVIFLHVHLCVGRFSVVLVDSTAERSVVGFNPGKWDSWKNLIKTVSCFPGNTMTGNEEKCFIYLAFFKH